MREERGQRGGGVTIVHDRRQGAKVLFISVMKSEKNESRQFSIVKVN